MFTICEYCNYWLLGGFCKELADNFKIYSILLQVFTEMCKSFFKV